jgi:hypothetical protein
MLAWTDSVQAGYWQYLTQIQLSKMFLSSMRILVFGTAVKMDIGIADR